jgi:hypothetical protein
LNKLQDLSPVLYDGTLLEELENTTKNLNVSLVESEMRDKAGVDAATLANNWGIGIEAAKRTRLVITQRGIRRMIHPSLTKRYKTNDSQLRYCRLPVIMYTDTMHSKILSRQENKEVQICCTYFGFVRSFPMKSGRATTAPIVTAAPGAAYVWKSYKTKNDNYFWSHGYQVGLAHISANCTKKAPGHKDIATKDNIMGVDTEESHFFEEVGTFR